MSVSVETGWWVTLFLSVFFSGMEIAFVSSDKLRYAVRKKSTGIYNYMLNSIYGHPRQFLTTLLVWKVIVLILLVYLSGIIVRHRFSFGGESGLPLMLVFIVGMTFIILLTDEFLPRTLFRKNANFWVNLFVIPAFVGTY
ncbi:MAG: DUF21 domain-containing protein [Proteiniphilum sp.]